jgi:hypothetical protein
MHVHARTGAGDARTSHARRKTARVIRRTRDARQRTPAVRTLAPAARLLTPWTRTDDVANDPRDVLAKDPRIAKKLHLEPLRARGCQRIPWAQHQRRLDPRPCRSRSRNRSPNRSRNRRRSRSPNRRRSRSRNRNRSRNRSPNRSPNRSRRDQPRRYVPARARRCFGDFPSDSSSPTDCARAA